MSTFIFRKPHWWPRENTQQFSKPNRFNVKVPRKLSEEHLEHTAQDFVVVPSTDYALLELGSQTLVFSLNEANYCRGLLLFPFIDNQQLPGYLAIRDGLVHYVTREPTMAMAATAVHRAHVKELCFQTHA